MGLPSFSVVGRRRGNKTLKPMGLWGLGETCV